MITIKKLQWSNCFSYGPDNELDLNTNTVTQILGINGMGKSSIPLIIEEAFFNKNSKGIKKADIPNRYINDGYYICIEFSKDEDDYRVVVNRKATINVRLERNGQDISSHTATNTYKTLQDILGVDFKTFSQLVYQSTNASLQFLTATDTTRKKFLIDLLHLEDYVKLFDIFKEAAKAASSEVVAIQSKLSTIEKWLTDNKLEDTTLLPMLKIEIDTEEDEKELSRLTKEIENISEKNKKIIKNNKYKDLLKQIDLKEIQNIEITARKPLDELHSKIGTCNSIMDEARKLLHKLNSLGDTCPTCEQPVDNEFKTSLVSKEQAKLEEAERQRDDISRQIQSIKRDNELFDHKLRAQKDWEELYRSIDPELPTALLDERELTKSLENVRAKLLRARKSLEETARENQERTRRNTRIQVILEQIDAFTEQLNEHTEALKKKERLLSNLEVLKKSFSTNGLLAYKIENLVKELEELANAYLAELSDGRFTLEFTVSNDKLNVIITDNGNIVDILSLSSGELARVNTATLIAIRKLMSSISKSKINILFLDEVINVLDVEGRERLVEVLTKEEELNTYIVSHGWSHPLLEKIEVVKVGNISKLEK